MRKSSMGWLIAAVLLIVLGAVIFVVIMSTRKWDFKEIGNVEYKEYTFDITDNFTNIDVDTDTEDITFKPSTDGKCSVVFYVEDYKTPEANVKSGTLEIKTTENRKWYDHISPTFSFEDAYIYVYLPENEYERLNVNFSTGDITIPSDFTFSDIVFNGSTGDVSCRASSKGDLKIKLSTGDIDLSDISAENADLTVSTGKVTVSSLDCKGRLYVKVSTGKSVLTDITAKSFTSEGSTGHITLTDAVFTESLNIKRSTGKVDLNDCDAADIKVVTDTGNINGTLLSEKVFITHSDTGHISVPDSTSGGRCDLSTDTGDIRIKLK